MAINISGMTHTLPVDLLPGTTYNMKVRGATSTSGHPVLYSLHSASVDVSFSKTVGIVADENIVVTTAKNENPLTTFKFSVAAYEIAGSAHIEVSTPYTEEDLLTLSYTQSADIIYLASPNHPPKKLMRFADVNWVLQDISFRPSIGTPSAPSLSVAGSVPASGRVTNYYVVTVIDGVTGDESYPSPVANIESDALTQTYYIAISAHAVGDIAEYRFYKRKGGSYGFIGRSTDGKFEDRNFGADTSDSPPREKNPFTGANNYPSLVFLWQQRLGWAATRAKPLTLWMSRSGNYENMAASLPPKDDDGIEATLASSGQNKIMWIAGEQVLVMGTTGAEYTITGVDGGAAITPTSLSFARQSGYGSSQLGALTAAGNLLFSQRGIGDFHEFTYNFQKDRYVAPSMILLSTHLIQDKDVLEWAWQSTENTLWVVLSDGTMAGCTYMPDHEIIGWHRHDTDGFILDAVCIPGQRRDKLFMLVRRTINGVQKTYIEVMAEPFSGNNVRRAYYVDCGLTYDGSPISNLAGLNHLEGKGVFIFADGATVEEQQVVGGEIQLPYPASVVHVGLPFTTEIIPNRPEVATEQGSSISRKQAIVQAAIRFYQSMNVTIGQEGGKVFDTQLHNVLDPVNPAFVSSEVDLVVNAGWDRDKRLRFVVNDPVPMTIVCVVYGMRMAPQI